jgi:hypothetical protein
LVATGLLLILILVLILILPGRSITPAPPAAPTAGTPPGSTAIIA